MSARPSKGAEARARALANLSAKLEPAPSAATLAAVASGPATAPAEDEGPRRVPLELVYPSPFQPRGRPSGGAVRAVEEAAAAAGSLSILMDEEGAKLLAKLDSEARALAELAADVEANGVDTALEVRRTPRGLELLAGHRRLAAARLAGLADVPVDDRGEMSDDDAAAVVFRRNRLRSDFTAWQEAVSLQALQERRRAAGLPDGVRALAKQVGYSAGRAGELLQVARAFPAEVLAELGGGEAGVAEEALSRLPYRTLRKLIAEEEQARLEAARRATGLPAPQRPDQPDGAAAPLGEGRSAVYERVERRGGGFTLTVLKAIDRMTGEEADELLSVFQETVRQIRAQSRRVRG